MPTLYGLYIIGVHLYLSIASVFPCVCCVCAGFLFCFSNLFSHWLLSELYSRSFNRFLECLPLLGRRKGGIYSCSARWGFLYFLPCVVCAVCVSLVGCTSCLFHRLSRSARVALTFELFLGFFQLFRFFFETLPLRVCVYSQGLDIYRKHIQQIYIFIYIVEIFYLFDIFSLPFFFFCLFSLLFMRVCVSFMNMTDMCKYGMN